jgi:serine/threonine protein kinase/WD40 repeat protein
MEKPGERIGRYKLLQQIGEGGCGVVYMAEQEQPVRRRVALKVIKLGMDTKQVIARFEAERQALALMDHPNIAKVLDGGATETGRPYFVMELVRGTKITDYCDANNLSTAERLKLFVQVCQAIQHAHQKGIIHRDIKPSNILVTVNDGVPVPKVIDFGIAKATAGPLTDKTLFTAFEQFIGTPAYMSPEQAEMTSLDIDTRSDIYSVGVLLYELLTSKTPFDARELLAAGLEAIRRTIREVEPPRPSTRLSTMVVGELTTTAEHRQTDPPRLIHLVRGDLDWIVMKCLEKDRTRRYETANGLARDIERHLTNEPVVARPPSQLYRLQKLVRRHKMTVVAASAIIAAIIAGAAISTWQALRATKAQREQQRLRETADLARQKESGLRQNAERARAAEAIARQQADSNALEAQRLLRVAYLANANALGKRGDGAGALVMLVAALKLADNNKHSQLAVRINAGMVLRQLPSLERAVFLELPKTNPSWGDSGTIQPVFLSPNGGRVAVIGDYAEGFRHATNSLGTYILLCDTASGKRIGEALRTLGDCQDVEFSADGRLFVAAAPGGAYVCDAVSGGLKKRLEGGVAMARFSSEGTRVVGLGFHLQRLTYSGVTVWDVGTGQVIAKLPLDAAIQFAVTSPSGRFVFYQTAASPGGWGAYVWDWAQNRTVGLETNPRGIDSAEFSPDEKWLTCHFIDSHSVELINLETGARLKRLEGIPASQFRINKILYSWTLWDRCAAFTPDGAHLLLWGEDSSMGIWDMDSWRTSGVRLDHPAPLLRIALSPDGRQLATMTLAYALRIWDVETGQPLTVPITIPHLHQTSQWTGKEFDMKFSSNGRSLAVVGQGMVLSWRLPESAPAPQAKQTTVSSLEFSADGKRVLSVDRQTGRASILDAKTAAELARIQSEIGIERASFSRDACLVLTEALAPGAQAPVMGKADQELWLSVWDSARGTALASNVPVQFVHQTQRTSLNVAYGYRSESSARAEYSGLPLPGDGTIFGELTEAVIVPPITFYKEDREAKINSRTDQVDSKQGKVSLNDHLGLPTFALLSSDGTVLLLGRGQDSARAYMMADGSPVGPPLIHCGRLIDAVFTSDNHQVLTLSAQRTCEKWDLASGNLLGKVQMAEDLNTLLSLALSTDGRYFVVRGEFHTIVEPVDGHRAWYNDFRVRQVGDFARMQLVFDAAPAGMLGYGRNRSASPGMNSARVYDTESGQPITPPLTHEDGIREAKLSPDEHLIATAGGFTASVWNAETGLPVSPPLIHCAPVTAVAFAADSQFLAAGTSNGVVRIWDLHPTSESWRDLLEPAMLAAGRGFHEDTGLVALRNSEVQELLAHWQRQHSAETSSAGEPSSTNRETSIYETGPEDRYVTAFFPNIWGLRPGDPVNLEGTVVGWVKLISFDTSEGSERVMLHLAILDRHWARIRVDSTASIVLDEKAGEFFVDLKPGSTYAPEISPGGVLATEPRERVVR